MSDIFMNMRMLCTLMLLGVLNTTSAETPSRITGGYMQSFDGLHPRTIRADALPPGNAPHSLAGDVFSRSEKMKGWYFFNAGRANISYRVYGAEGASAGIVNFGSDKSRNRSLGSISNGSSACPVFGFLLKNDTAEVVSSVVIRYHGEQWRNGEEPAELTFSYAVSASPDLMSKASFIVGGPSFNMTSGTGKAADAKKEGRIAELGGLLENLQWKPGEYILLRWENRSKGAGFAIDNFSMMTLGEEVVKP